MGKKLYCDWKGREVCCAGHVQYESCKTVVRCPLGGIQDGGGTPPRITFELLIVMDRLTDEIGQESLRVMMFADDIVICGESRERGR